MGEVRNIYTEADVAELSEALNARMGEGWKVEFSRQGRTGKQNNCLHRWCDEMAKRLNDAGFDQKAVMEKIDGRLDIPCSTLSVKEIYKAVLKAMEGKDSTTEMDTVEPSQITEIVGKRMSELYGITAPPFPSQSNGGGRE